MEVMTNHKFHDEDVERVFWRTYGHEDNREIILKSCSLIINKKDIIAFAKEFGLLVFEKDSAL